MDPAGTLLSIAEIFIRLQDFADLFDEAPRTLSSIKAQIKVVESGVRRIQEWMHFTDPTSKAAVQESLQEAIATVDDSVGSLQEDLDAVLRSGPNISKLLGRQGSDKWTRSKFAWNEQKIAKHVTDMRECALLLSFTLTVCQLPLDRPAEHEIEELRIGARTLSRAHKSTRDKRRFMLNDAKDHVPDQSADFKVFIEGILDAEKTLPDENDTEKSMVDDAPPALVAAQSPQGLTGEGAPFLDSANATSISVQDARRKRGDELFLESLPSGAGSVPLRPPKIDKHTDAGRVTSSQDSGNFSSTALLPSTNPVADTRPGAAVKSSHQFDGTASSTGPHSINVMPRTDISPSLRQKALARKPVRSTATLYQDAHSEKQLDNTYSSEKITVLSEEMESLEVVSSVEKQACAGKPRPSSPPPYMTRMSSQVFQSSIRSRIPPARSGSDQTPVSPSNGTPQLSEKTHDMRSASTSSCPEMIQAVRDNQEHRVQELMQQRDNVFAQDPLTGRTALLEAVHRSNRELCRVLLKRGSRPNHQDVEGRTALHIAAKCDDSVICRMLLTADAFVNVGDSRGHTPLWLAAETGSCEAVVCLLEVISSSPINNAEVLGPFYEAVKLGDVPTAEAFLVKHVKLKSIKQPWKLAINAALSGNTRMLDLVLVQKSAYKASDPEGLTMLHHAAKRGHTHMIERLLDMGVSWKSQTKQRKQTALHLAIAHHQPSTALILIQHKTAKVTMADVDDEEPIHLATRTGDFELVTALLASGAKLKTRSSYGWRPLHIAAAYGHVALIANFITHGVDLEDRISSPSFKPGKKTNEAARRGYWAEIRWPHEEARALHLAIEFGHAEMARLLLASGAKVDAVDSQRWQPLHHAAFHCEPDVVEALLEKGASPHATTQDGNTPLGLGFREHGLAASQEDRNHVTKLLQDAAEKQQKSGFTLKFRLGGAGTKSARERNMVWHTAEMAEALYRNRGVETGEGAWDDDEETQHGDERRSSAASSDLMMSSVHGFDSRTSSLSLGKSPT